MSASQPIEDADQTMKDFDMFDDNDLGEDSSAQTKVPEF